MEKPVPPQTRALTLLTLALLAILPFVGGLNGDFIEDDRGVIRENVHLRAGGDFSRAFTENYWRDQTWGGLYRPLTVASYAIDRIVWGAEPSDGPPAPFGIHATNLILHALATCLVFGILARRLGASSGERHGASSAVLYGAWCGAALFAVHPVHVEAVVHMVGRADVLATVFFLGAWRLHINGTSAGRWGAAALYLGSLLSKELGAALPALLLAETLLLDRWPGVAAAARRAVRELWPYAVALAIFVGLRGVVLGASLDPPQAFVLYSPGVFVAFQDPAPGEVGFTMLHAFGEYLRLFVAPLELSADYTGFPHHTGWERPVVVSALVLGALVASAVVAFRRGCRQPALWLSFSVWSFLPVSNLLLVSGIVMAERVAYLPALTVCGLFGAGVSWFAAQPKRRPLALGLAGVLIAAATTRSVLRVPVWSDTRTLFEETIEHNRYPGHLAYGGLCEDYVEELRASPTPDPELLQRAVTVGRKALKHYKSLHNVTHLAWLLEQTGKLGESLRLWEQARLADLRTPGRRGSVTRLIERILAQPDETESLRIAVRVGRASLAFSRAHRLQQDVGYWTHHQERLLLELVERAGRQRAWDAGLEGLELLGEFAPGHALLTSAGPAIFTGAARAAQEAGDLARARLLAEALLRLDPGNAFARGLLGR